MIVIRSPRLRLSQFALADAPDVFACITPAITAFLPCEPPSWSEYLGRCERSVQAPEPHVYSFVVRRLDDEQCLGMASLEHGDAESPELGRWLAEHAHGRGFGREVVTALVDWGHTALEKNGFVYPVAVHDVASRPIAESLGGELVGRSTNPKYESVVYVIPWQVGVTS